MLVTIYNRRDNNFDVNVCNPDGTPFVLQAGDRLRVKIGTEQNTPVIDLKGGVASANGSSFTNTNPFTLFLKKADVELIGKGIHQLEVLVYDASSSGPYHAQYFQLHVRGSMSGNTGS